MTTINNTNSSTLATIASALEALMPVAASITNQVDNAVSQAVEEYRAAKRIEQALPVLGGMLGSFETLRILQGATEMGEQERELREAYDQGKTMLAEFKANGRYAIGEKMVPVAQAKEARAAQVEKENRQMVQAQKVRDAAEKVAAWRRLENKKFDFRGESCGLAEAISRLTSNRVVALESDIPEIRGMAVDRNRKVSASDWLAHYDEKAEAQAAFRKCRRQALFGTLAKLCRENDVDYDALTDDQRYTAVKAAEKMRDRFAQGAAAPKAKRAEKPDVDAGSYGTADMDLLKAMQSQPDEDHESVSVDLAAAKHEAEMAQAREYEMAQARDAKLGAADAAQRARAEAKAAAARAKAAILAEADDEEDAPRQPRSRKSKAE